ncbi:glycosyl-phosphatidylinositol-anchored molecule-like protein [Tupaia chinensis]|uniref:glycosyl-phosphatidylinositol-anchored molecule-like protein n=1 Tax=Tupaia chinensis TaxID=246437 RepID=UPI000FFC5BB7|nr:glycosyl-phosphatidylinositol-anchored molecule-like protein [Tupaia chinensis]
MGCATPRGVDRAAAGTRLRFQLLQVTMLPLALVLSVVLPPMDSNVTNVTTAGQSHWTYSLVCHDCAAINDFNCGNQRVCPYEIRRCLTIAIRVNSRELLIYKNCTNNCTFLYPSEVPPAAPKKAFKTNSFYFVRCCGAMRCNEGGPTNTERDLLPDYTIEEELTEGTVHLRESKFLLSFAATISIIVSSTLTGDPPWRA